MTTIIFDPDKEKEISSATDSCGICLLEFQPLDQPKLLDCDQQESPQKAMNRMSYLSQDIEN